ncbi:unnamed protein product [Knipowitschia caucasica]
MLLLQMLMFTLVDFSSSYETPTRCYGTTYSFSPPQLPNSIFYMPRTRDERILVAEKGKSKHERFDVTLSGISIKDLTDEDDQAILFFDQENSMQLKIDDCNDPQKAYYGEDVFFKIPRSAEYLQFSQVVPYESTLQPVVIWNRTDPSLRGSVIAGYFEIKKAKQTNNGYYKYRDSQNQLLKWRRLEVQEVRHYFEVTEGDKVNQQFPPGFSFQHILYTPDDSTDELLIEERYVNQRMNIYHKYFNIFDVVKSDSGIYKFVDIEGNVAVRVQLEVKEVEIPTWAYVVFAVAIILGIIICCCCVKKCCCKKDQRNIPDSTTAAPAVFYHESNQPAPPAIPLLSREPVRYMADPTTNVVASMDPPQFTQATIPAEPGPISGTNSDFEPKFVVKGSIFPSAPPLSADSSIQDVYTSDKLNFL